MEVYLIYNVVLISTGEQSDSVMHMCVHSFACSLSLWFIIGYCVEFSVLYLLYSLLFTHSIHNSLPSTASVLNMAVTLAQLFSTGIGDIFIVMTGVELW